MTILKLFCAIILLFEPHTLSSPFHTYYISFFRISFSLFFRANHGLWSLQEGLHWVDRNGGEQEPHPHLGSALQVPANKAKLAHLYTLDIDIQPLSLNGNIQFCAPTARICAHWPRCLQTSHTGSIRYVFLLHSPPSYYLGSTLKH